MTAPDARDNEFLDLMFDLAEDRLSPPQTARLEELLQADPARRRQYVDFMLIVSGLHRIRGEGQEAGGLGSGSSRLGIRDFTFPSSDSPGKSPEPQSPDSEPLIAPIIIQTSPDLPSPFFPLSSSLSDWLLSYAAATVIVGAAILGAWAYKVSLEAGTDILPVQVADTGKVPVPPAPPELVGRITGAADCRWADGQEAPSAAVPLGRKYELASGLMEIAYETGARVILQGPCTYEVDSAAGGFLSLGKLTARVEKKNEVVSGQWAVGSEAKSQDHYPLATSHYPLFAVRTPTAVVTDLGTEFGVEVNGEGTTQTEVFVGKVAVVSVGEGRTAGEKRHLVQAGQRARIEGNDVLLTTVDDAGASEKRFVRKMSSKEAQEADAYAQMVLALQPVVYYRMEPPTDGNRRLVFDSGPNGCHGTFYTNNEFSLPRVTGRFGRAIYFGGPSVGDYVFVPNYPKAAHDQLTVSAWVLARSRGLWYPVIAANWGNIRLKGQFSLCLCQYDGDLGFYVSQRDGEQIGVREGASRPLPWDTWQHVAGVLDKSVLRLYRNGVEVASGPCNGLSATPPISGLTIGSKKDDGNERASGFFWHGRIDELAIFNRALSAVDIQRLSGRIADRPQDGSSGSAGEATQGSHEERRVSTDKK